MTDTHTRDTSNHTPRRTVRVPDDVWEAAGRRADHEGTTVSAEVVKHLARYAKGAPPVLTREQEAEQLRARLAELTGADQ